MNRVTWDTGNIARVPTTVTSRSTYHRFQLRVPAQRNTYPEGEHAFHRTAVGRGGQMLFGKLLETLKPPGVLKHNDSKACADHRSSLSRRLPIFSVQSTKLTAAERTLSELKAEVARLKATVHAGKAAQPQVRKVNPATHCLLVGFMCPCTFSRSFDTRVCC